MSECRTAPSLLPVIIFLTQVTHRGEEPGWEDSLLVIAHGGEHHDVPRSGTCREEQPSFRLEGFGPVSGRQRPVRRPHVRTRHGPREVHRGPRLLLQPVEGDEVELRLLGTMGGHDAHTVAITIRFPAPIRGGLLGQGLGNELTSSVGADVLTMSSSHVEQGAQPVELPVGRRVGVQGSLLEDVWPCLQRGIGGALTTPHSPQGDVDRSVLPEIHGSHVDTTDEGAHPGKFTTQLCWEDGHLGIAGISGVRGLRSGCVLSRGNGVRVIVDVSGPVWSLWQVSRRTRHIDICCLLGSKQGRQLRPVHRATMNSQPGTEPMHLFMGRRRQGAVEQTIHHASLVVIIASLGQIDGGLQPDDQFTDGWHLGQDDVLGTPISRYVFSSQQGGQDIHVRTVAGQDGHLFPGDSFI